MYENAHYHHPDVEPYSRGAWREVLYSWLLALGVVAGVLAAL